MEIGRGRASRMLPARLDRVWIPQLSGFRPVLPFRLPARKTPAKGNTMRIFFCLFLAGSAMAAGVHFRQSGFSPNPEGWTVWSERAETMPRTFIEPVISRGEPGSLAVSGGGNIGAYGGWTRKVPGIEAGRWYRFTACYHASGITSENWQILPRIDWLTAKGERAGGNEHVDYAARSVRRGAWTEVFLETEAPPEAVTAVIQLFLAHAPSGIVWWDDIAFDEIPIPGPRNVTIATINLKPEKTGSPAESVGQFIAAAERLAPPKTDVILLPEGITVVGTGKSYADVSEPVPGPTTERLGELARKEHSYVAAGLYERDGAAVYNTAVLLDRGGNLIGRYRKVHLPMEEMEKLTPGDEYPVFRTDFGTVGLMICYDVFFPDPARALALQGAEIVLLPIWGGNETLAAARAIENHVFLVASGYDHPTYITDPEGNRLVQAKDRGTAAIATVDLNKRYLYFGLWDWKGRRPREYRPDVKSDFMPVEANP
jgi:predicted amidohydrolase